LIRLPILDTSLFIRLLYLLSFSVYHTSPLLYSQQRGIESNFSPFHPLSPSLSFCSPTSSRLPLLLQTHPPPNPPTPLHAAYLLLLPAFLSQHSVPVYIPADPHVDMTTRHPFVPPRQQVFPPTPPSAPALPPGKLYEVRLYGLDSGGGWCSLSVHIYPSTSLAS
jgi:hypothetical protein